MADREYDSRSEDLAALDSSLVYCKVCTRGCVKGYVNRLRASVNCEYGQMGIFVLLLRSLNRQWNMPQELHSWESR